MRIASGWAGAAGWGLSKSVKAEKNLKTQRASHVSTQAILKGMRPSCRSPPKKPKTPTCIDTKRRGAFDCQRPAYTSSHAANIHDFLFRPLRRRAYGSGLKDVTLRKGCCITAHLQRSRERERREGVQARVVESLGWHLHILLRLLSGISVLTSRSSTRYLSFGIWSPVGLSNTSWAAHDCSKLLTLAGNYFWPRMFRSRSPYF